MIYLLDILILKKVNTLSLDNDTWQDGSLTHIHESAGNACDKYDEIIWKERLPSFYFGKVLLNDLT